MGLPSGGKSLPHALRAIGVSRSFAGVQALTDVSLTLARGEIVGLIGPNGAGKTTLVNLLTGFDRPDTGVIELDHNDVTSWKATQRCRAGLGRTFQHGHSFAELSVRENIEVAALGVGLDAREARRFASGLLERLGLASRAAERAGGLPHGDERRLGVARALATRPHYVLMDEPAAGLNEHEARDFSDVVRSVAIDDDVGVLLIDHNVGLVLSVSDRIHVLDQGRTLAEGTSQEVRANADVAHAYLGGA